MGSTKKQKPNVERRLTSRSVARGQWDNSVQFMLACIGYSVGFDNIWRFPYLCYKNGGGIGWGMVCTSFLLTVCYNMILAWVFIYFVISFRENLLWSSCRNEWNSGATFPYVILVVLLVRGVTLDGAIDGIMFYITPDLTKLKDIQVWKAAATQIFYSSGVASGGLLTMASYNEFNNNCFRDALVVCFANCATSVFAGFAVFSIVGFMAHDLELPVSEVVKDGIGLTFIAYPEAISRMPISSLWAVLFFFMLITLGLDSVFGISETITTAIKDQFTCLRKYTSLVAFVVCLISCLCGLPLCSRAGIYFFTLFCNYVGWPLMVFGLCEVFAAAWIYGLGNLIEDIRMMLGQPKHCLGHIFGPTGWFFKTVWKLLDPVYIIGLLIGVIVFHESSSYGDYIFPAYVEWGGWIVSAMAVSMIPIFAIYRIICSCCEGQSCKDLFRPSEEWCPAEERKRLKWMAKYGVPDTTPMHTTTSFVDGEPVVAKGSFPIYVINLNEVVRGLSGHP